MALAMRSGRGVAGDDQDPCRGPAPGCRGLTGRTQRPQLCARGLALDPENREKCHIHWLNSA